MGKFFNDSKEELIRVYYIKEKGRWAKVAWNGGLLQVKVKTPAHKLEYLNWKSNPKGLSSSLPYDGFSNRGRGVCCIVCIISFPRRKKNKITLRKRKENQLLLPISLSLSLSTLSIYPFHVSDNLFFSVRTFQICFIGSQSNPYKNG